MSAAGSDDDLLDELDQDLDEGVKTGGAVADSLANIANKRKMSEDKLKERFDKYLRPSNCAALQVPLVNRDGKPCPRSRGRSTSKRPTCKNTATQTATNKQKTNKQKTNKQKTNKTATV